MRDARKKSRAEPVGETRARSIMTVLFTDILDSTRKASELGDGRWRKLLDRHDQLVRDELSRFGGREVETAGDGFMVTFETPATGIACALAILAGVEKLGLSLRAGIHTGECEHREKGLAGIAVHLAARIAAEANAGELLVSSTVKDLAAGGEFAFTARGAHSLKGIPGRARLYVASHASVTRRRSSGKKVAKPSPRARPRSSAGSAGKITILIVDDHPLWRQTIRTLIERAGAAREILEAGEGGQAVEVARARRPDVVLMDMALPGLHGLEATREISRASPETRILVLSSSDDEEQVMEAVQAGAAGYLLKTAGPAEILDGILRVNAGELVFPPSLAKLVLTELRGGGSTRPPGGPLSGLTERESEVLALMAQGHTNEVIGKTLFLSPKTVESHVASIFSKLGLDPSAGGHRRVLAVVKYLSTVRDKRGG